MEEGRILQNKKQDQVMYLNLSDYPFLKGRKLGDKGFIKTKGEVISERSDDNDIISKLIRIKKIQLMEESRRIT